MNYVGIDHPRQYSHLTMPNQEGQVLRCGRVANVRVEIEKVLEVGWGYGGRRDETLQVHDVGCSGRDGRGE